MPRARLAILLLGGSFNPIHLQHIAIFHIAREWLRQNESVEVVAGFLVLTSDEYLAFKFRKTPEDIIPFLRRLQLAEAACRDSDFVSAYPFPYAAAGELLLKLMNETGLPGFMLCGADMIMRQAYQDFDVVVFERAGMEKQLQEALHQRVGKPLSLDERQIMWGKRARWWMD